MGQVVDQIRMKARKLGGKEEINTGLPRSVVERKDKMQ